MIVCGTLSHVPTSEGGTPTPSRKTSTSTYPCMEVGKHHDRFCD